MIRYFSLLLIDILDVIIILDVIDFLDVIDIIDFLDVIDIIDVLSSDQRFPMQVVWCAFPQ